MQVTVGRRASRLSLVQHKRKRAWLHLESTERATVIRSGHVFEKHWDNCVYELQTARAEWPSGSGFRRYQLWRAAKARMGTGTGWFVPRSRDWFM